MTARAEAPTAADAMSRRAAPLRGRLQRAADAGWAPPPEPSEASGDRMAEWCKVAARGDATLFARRLAWDGWDAVAAARALAGDAAEDTPTPAWAELLHEAFGGSSAELRATFAALPDADPVTQPDARLPFEELLLPLVALARRRLAAAAGEAALTQLEPGARHQLERLLLARLAHLCSRALYAEFSVFRACRQQGGLGALLAGGGRQAPLYAAFVAEMQAGRLLRFFGEYAVAARLCGTVTALWVDATAEFVRRLATDVDALRATFAAGASLGLVTDVAGSVSDAHEGGRQVLLLRFSSGRRLVYKPRPLGLEEHFGRLVRWANERGATPPLRHLAVLDRTTHGWIDFAEHGPCDDEQQLRRYHERCGMLLCLVYALNGSDFHYENLIAAGEHPVLIDMEALMGAEVDLSAVTAPADDPLAAAARRLAERTVLRVHMLPSLKVTTSGQAVEIGGIAGRRPAVAEEESVASGLGWRAPNTDAMRLVPTVLPPAAPHKNAPTLRGAPVDGARYVASVVAGFEQLYRLLLAHQDEWRAPGGPLDGLRAQQVRVIFRHTSLYAALIERGLHPSYLRDGIDRSIQIDALARPLLAFDERPAAWPLLRAEHDAVERLDVPLFVAGANDTSLTLPSGEVIADCFRTSAHAAARERAAQLGESDLALQVGLIHAAFDASGRCDLRAPSVRAPSVRAPSVRAAADARPERAAPTGAAPDRAALRERVLAHAARAADATQTLVRSSAASGGVWPTIAYLPRARRYAVQTAGCNLFDGYLGAALFLAAASRVSGGAYRAAARAALQPLPSSLAELERLAAARRTLDLGAATGIGSAIYALVRIADLLDEPGLLQDAQRAARLVTADVVATDRAYGVVSGAAGAILGLLALYRATGDLTVVERAAECARHLGAARVVDKATGLRAWPTRLGAAEPGLAHGQAGIAFALQRLAEVTGDAATAAVAAEAVEHERHLVGPALERLAPDELVAAWSRGASGVGLARLAGLAVLDTPAVRAELEAAVHTAGESVLAGVDTLCCGAAGRIELLLAAGRRLGRPEHVDAALRASAQLVARADARGGAFETGWGDQLPTGLFQGRMGAVYGLLRVTHPDVLPSVLVWD